MSVQDKDRVYIDFLETINKELNIESLYQSSLKNISTIFNSNRIQIWHEIKSAHEMSVLHEYVSKEEETSMIAYHLPQLPKDMKTILNGATIWNYLNVKEEELTRCGIKSLIGIDFQFAGEKKGILVLTFESRDKKLEQEELLFLIKLKAALEVSICRLEKYHKTQDEFKRLQDQNNKLREQDRLKINFINNISHEIRTPLASILGFSKILSTKANLSPEIKETAEQIQQAASRLSTLITDFLQVNKIDSESWLAHFEPCDLGEVVKNAVEEFSSLNKKHKISYFISNNYPIIKTDPKLFRQIIDNLILNAIKYSPALGNITVSLNVSQDNKELIVSISDEGIGIEKEEISKIFSRFYRSTNPQIQKIPGSGLGLAICKEILTTLNGKIEVESIPDKGSKFTVILPVY